MSAITFTDDGATILMVVSGVPYNLVKSKISNLTVVGNTFYFKEQDVQHSVNFDVEATDPPAANAEDFRVIFEAYLDSVPYKKYVVLVTQTNGAPAATVLENTLGGIVVWTKNSAGNFWGTLAGAFPAGKTFIIYPPFNEGSNPGDMHFVYRDTDNRIEWEAEIEDTTSTDGLITNHSLEIRVYS